MNKVNMTVFLNKQKRSTKTGKTPIYLRFYGTGKLEVRLSKLYDLDDKEIHKWNEFSQRIDQKNSFVNDYLNEISKRFKTFKNEALISGQDFSLEEIKNYVLHTEKQKQQPTVIEYCEKYLLEEVENNISRKEGTKKNYRNAIKQFCNYLNFHGLKNLKFKDLSYSIADGFKKYLETEIIDQPDKKKNTEVSSSTKIKNLKAVFIKAIKEKLIEENPFKGIKLIMHNNEAPIYLNMRKLKSIYDLDVSKNPQLQFVKDFLLFMCFTGMSVGDAINFSKDFLEERNDGRYVYDTSRRKTGMKIKQVLLKYSQEIIEKYIALGYYKNHDNKIFPQLSDVDINRKIKLIAAMTKISENISTKVGRKTCSNMIDEAGLEQHLLINSYMGWSNAKDIRGRYSAISYEKLCNFSERLEKYISESFK